MAIVQVSDFGKDAEGVRTYRVNGDKTDLQKAIDELGEAGWGFFEEPSIVKVHRGYSVLLRLYNPLEQ